MLIRASDTKKTHTFLRGRTQNEIISKRGKGEKESNDREEKGREAQRRKKEMREEKRNNSSLIPCTGRLNYFLMSPH